MAGEPLFAVEPVDWSVPNASGYDAILAGSANAFRYGGEGLKDLASLPVLAVGAATAEAAGASDFQVEEIGARGMQALVDRLEERFRRLLRLTGQTRVQLRPTGGFEIDERIVYGTRALPLPERIAADLRKGGVVALHSGAAAEHFCGECDRLGLHRSLISIIALAPRVAERAGGGWRAVDICPLPTDAALLALAEPLCKNAR